MTFYDASAAVVERRRSACLRRCSSLLMPLSSLLRVLRAFVRNPFRLCPFEGDGSHEDTKPRRSEQDRYDASAAVVERQRSACLRHWPPASSCP